MYKNDTRDLETKWEKIVYKGHTSIMAFVYGFLSDGAVFFAREMKHYPKYIQVHGILTMIISSTTFFYTSAMISISINLINIDYQYLWVPDLREKSRVIQSHFVVGLIIMSLLLIQNFLGWAIKTNLESNKGDGSVYPAKNLHKYIGFFLYFAGKLNIMLGIYMYDRDNMQISNLFKAIPSPLLFFCVDDLDYHRGLKLHGYWYIIVQIN